MKLLFTLDMPNNNAWNGRWSGEGQFYGRIRSCGTAKKTRKRLQPILEKGYFYYNFGDGWGASVTVTEATAQDVQKVKKSSRGFCGYDWMIDSILTWGEILTYQQERDRYKALREKEEMERESRERKLEVGA